MNSAHHSRLIAIAVVLLAATRAPSQSTAPTRPPTLPAVATRPANLPAATVSTVPPPFSRDYNLLLSKSIFSRNRFTPGNITDPSGNTATTTESRVPVTLTFSGVVNADGALTAFIEDTAALRITRVQVGDLIGKSRVRKITLDTLDYELNGQVTSVTVGGLVNNGDSVTVLTPIAAPTSATPAPSGPTNDVLERLRQARLKAQGITPPTPPSPPTPPATTAPAPPP